MYPPLSIYKYMKLGVFNMDLGAEVITPKCRYLGVLLGNSLIVFFLGVYSTIFSDIDATVNSCYFGV
jgi:hypothetical protein